MQSTFREKQPGQDDGHGYALYQKWTNDPDFPPQFKLSLIHCWQSNDERSHLRGSEPGTSDLITVSLPGHHEDERKSAHLALGPASPPQPCHQPCPQCHRRRREAEKWCLWAGGQSAPLHVGCQTAWTKAGRSWRNKEETVRRESKWSGNGMRTQHSGCRLDRAPWRKPPQRSC